MLPSDLTEQRGLAHSHEERKGVRLWKSTSSPLNNLPARFWALSLEKYHRDCLGLRYIPSERAWQGYFLKSLLGLDKQSDNYTSSIHFLKIISRIYVYSDPIQKRNLGLISFFQHVFTAYSFLHVPY